MRGILFALVITAAAFSVASCDRRSTPVDSVVYLHELFEDLSSEVAAVYADAGLFEPDAFDVVEGLDLPGIRVSRAISVAAAALAPRLEEELIPRDYLDMTHPRIQLYLRELAYLLLDDLLMQQESEDRAFEMQRLGFERGGRAVILVRYTGRLLQSEDQPPSDVEFALADGGDGWRVDVGSFPMLTASPFDPSSEFLSNWIRDFLFAQSSSGWEDMGQALWRAHVHVSGFRSENDVVVGEGAVGAAYQAEGVRIVAIESMHFSRTRNGMLVQAIETHDRGGARSTRRAAYEMVWSPNGGCMLATTKYLW